MPIGMESSNGNPPRFVGTLWILRSRELTYPTLGKGKSSSKVALGRDMLVPRRVIKWLLELVVGDSCFFRQTFQRWEHSSIQK